MQDQGLFQPAVPQDKQMRFGGHFMSGVMIVMCAFAEQVGSYCKSIYHEEVEACFSQRLVEARQVNLCIRFVLNLKMRAQGLGSGL